MWGEINRQEIDKMQMLDLNETVDQLAKTNSVHWYGHALRKDKNNFLRRTLDFIVKGIINRGRPKKTWLKAVVEQSRKVGLIVNDADNCSRQRLGVNAISGMMRLIRPLILFRNKTGFEIKLDFYYFS